MKNRALFDQFMTAVTTRDGAGAKAMLHPDFTVVEAAGLPYAGTWRGYEGWRALNRAVRDAWADFHVETDEFLGETDATLVVRMTISGKARLTGTPFKTGILEIWRFEGGLIREVTPYYWDTHHLAAISRNV